MIDVFGHISSYSYTIKRIASPKTNASFLEAWPGNPALPATFEQVAYFQLALETAGTAQNSYFMQRKKINSAIVKQSYHYTATLCHHVSVRRKWSGVISLSVHTSYTHLP